MMIDITKLLEKMNVIKIFQEIKNTDWICIHRDIFKTILTVADEQQQVSENDMDQFLRMVSDDDFIELIEKPFNSYGYIKIDTELFILMEKLKQNRRKSYVFIREEYLSKLLIKAFIKYEWILKAMAIDYSKYVDKDVIETYKEYFEGNTRIIEELFREKIYMWDNQVWIMDFKTNTLYFKRNKRQIQWTNQEAESKFNEYLEGY